MSEDDSFSFPYQPYPVQRDLMRKMTECMDKGASGVFESPTGTGKTLSVICATLTWLQRKEQQQLQTLTEEDAKEDESGGDWMEEAKKKRMRDIEKEAKRDKKDFATLIHNRIQQAETQTKELKNTKAMPDGENSEENFDCDDDELLIREEDSERREAEEGEALSCVKVFYASRTHSQLHQIVEELAKTSFKPRLVTIASRSLLCANEKVTALKSNALINERCMELRKNKKDTKKTPGKKCARVASRSTCEYHRQDSTRDLEDHILSRRLTSPLQLLRAGKSAFGCPYFASRAALPLCQLVLLPYQVLLHDKARSSWGISLKNSIVVLDEAHNVMETVASLYSADLTLQQLQRALSVSREYCSRYRLQLSPRNLVFIRQVIAVTAALEALARNAKEDESLPIQTLISRLNLLDVNLFTLCDYMERVDLCRKLHGLQEIINIKGEEKKGVLAILQSNSTAPDATAPQPASSASPMYALKTFLESLTNACEDGRVLVQPAMKSLRFILLNPAARLSSTLAEAHSTIFVGGTMEPAHILMDALQKASTSIAPSHEVIRFTCQHVVPTENILCLAIGEWEDGRRAVLTSERRGAEEELRRICSALISLALDAPNGMVVFFPSFAFLDSFFRFITKSKLIDKLKAVKELFVERRGLADSNLWSGYCKAARSHRGALMLAVVGGRLSEGINFSDELGRCVVILGLPYPNKGSIELKEKMEYAEKQQKGNGIKLYESLCWHGVNQAVGRALRHAGDWAAIVLLDSRYSSSEKRKDLCSWLQPLVVTPPSLKEALVRIRHFYSNKLKLSSA